MGPRKNIVASHFVCLRDGLDFHPGRRYGDAPSAGRSTFPSRAPAVPARYPSRYPPDGCARIPGEGERDSGVIAKSVPG